MCAKVSSEKENKGLKCVLKFPAKKKKKEILMCAKVSSEKDN